MTFPLETKRLQLLPLDLPQLRLESQDPQLLATSLGLVPQPTLAADLELQSALGQMVQSLESCPQEWPWNTNWLIILPGERTWIGGCCFHGPPNPAGEAELGYGLDLAFRGNGYMHEAIKSLIAWAFSQPQITAIIAETDKVNLPSQRVLERLGMRVTRESDASLWWKLEGGTIPKDKECTDGAA
ncbi:MAG: GNAT family N-acetyltransferase [Anaerolineae bacterium]